MGATGQTIQRCAKHTPSFTDLKNQIEKETEAFDTQKWKYCHTGNERTVYHSLQWTHKHINIYICYGPQMIWTVKRCPYFGPVWCWLNLICFSVDIFGDNDNDSSHQDNNNNTHFFLIFCLLSACYVSSRTSFSFCSYHCHHINSCYHGHIAMGWRMSGHIDAVANYMIL